MRIEIRGQKGLIDDALRAQAEHRIRLGLSRFGSRVRRVAVHASDDNGPRGGQDKRCRITVTVTERGRFVVEAVDADLEVAVCRAVGRATRAVDRQVSRGRWTRGRIPPFATTLTTLMLLVGCGGSTDVTELPVTNSLRVELWGRAVNWGPTSL